MQTSDSSHQGHKAHASANIPHLDGFISGARQQEGTRLSTLLGLAKSTGRKQFRTLS